MIGRRWANFLGAGGGSGRGTAGASAHRGARRASPCRERRPWGVQQEERGRDGGRRSVTAGNDQVKEDTLNIVVVNALSLDENTQEVGFCLPFSPSCAARALSPLRDDL